MKQGYRTGYSYRQPVMRAGQQKLKLEEDIEIPPASQSHLEDNWIIPLRKLVEGRKTQDRLCWVNTPNNYQRIEIEETGTNDPKKITKVRSQGFIQLLVFKSNHLYIILFFSGSPKLLLEIRNQSKLINHINLFLSTLIQVNSAKSKRRLGGHFSMFFFTLNKSYIFFSLNSTVYKTKFRRVHKVKFWKEPAGKKLLNCLQIKQLNEL